VDTRVQTNGLKTLQHEATCNDTYDKQVSENLNMKTHLDDVTIDIFQLFGKDGEEPIDMVTPRGNGPGTTPTLACVHLDHSEVNLNLINPKVGILIVVKVNEKI
jgi:hypothetical protein